MTAQKVYTVGYVEFWIGMKLASDAELMYTYTGAQIDTSAYPTTGDQQAFCTGAIDSFNAEFKAAFTADWSLQGGFMLWGQWSGGAVVPPRKYLDGSAPVVGLRGSGGSAPQNTAVLVHKTVTYGRGGRMYIPGVSEAAVSPNGALDGTELTIWQDALDAAHDNLSGFIGANFTYWAIQSAFTPTSTYTDVKEVTNHVVDGVVATQRRRLRR
jgi:hypothetical protein